MCLFGLFMFICMVALVFLDGDSGVFIVVLMFVVQFCLEVSPSHVFFLSLRPNLPGKSYFSCFSRSGCHVRALASDTSLT